MSNIKSIHYFRKSSGQANINEEQNNIDTGDQQQQQNQEQEETEGQYQEGGVTEGNNQV